MPPCQARLKKEEVQKGLNSASKYIRSELAHRLSLKYTPRISFREDYKEKKIEEVDRLFDLIEKEHPQDEGQDEKEVQE